jgi:transcriptional regulator with XRE-family HTH domain
MSVIEFKDRLKYVIGEGSNVTAFARKCGFTEGLLRSYLSGKSLPGLDKLIKISETADVSIDWLANGNEIVTEKTAVKIAGYVTGDFNQAIPVSYEIDDLFTTRLQRELGNKTIEWLSDRSHVESARLEEIVTNKVVPTVGELIAIAESLRKGGVNPRWLAQRSPSPRENWEYELYKNNETTKISTRLFKLYLVEVENYLIHKNKVIRLSPEKKANIIGAACRIHIKETPLSNVVNHEVIEHLVKL